MRNESNNRNLQEMTMGMTMEKELAMGTVQFLSPAPAPGPPPATCSPLAIESFWKKNKKIYVK